MHLVPAPAWTMDKMGSKHVEIIRANDKQKITDAFCGSAAGDLLPLQLVNKSKTNVSSSFSVSSRLACIQLTQTLAHRGGND